MSVPVIRGLTPIIERLPLFRPSLSQCESFAEREGAELVRIDVEKRDYSQARVCWEIALIGTVADGRRFGVAFMADVEHLWRADMALRAEAAERRKAWHDWTN